MEILKDFFTGLALILMILAIIGVGVIVFNLIGVWILTLPIVLLLYLLGRLLNENF